MLTNNIYIILIELIITLFYFFSQIKQVIINMVKKII